MEIEKLSRFNSWWASKIVRTELLMPIKRPLFNSILNYLEDI